jgi:esterase/lipase
MAKTNHKLFRDPGIKYPVYDLNLSFEDYIEQSTKQIANNRLDLENYTNPDFIIKANSPFELKPTWLSSSTAEQGKKYGVLLLHGLYDCPFIMQDIGQYLHGLQFLVRSILLPGHGTVPGGLLNVAYQDWLQATHYGITSLAKEVDAIFLVGFSTGASLALHYHLQNTPHNIAGLILLAPAIQISALSCLAKYPPKFSAHWLHTDEENDYTKYKSFTYNSAYQVYLLTQAIKALSQKKSLACPVFISMSADDQTVSSKATLQYFKKYCTQQSEVVFYTKDKSVLHDPRIIQRDAAYPQWNIINMSHVSLPIAANNIHYGMRGDYIHASHVMENLHAEKKYVYGTINTWKEDVLNSLSQIGLRKNYHVRLTFNPDFDFLQQAIGRFMQKIIAP